MFCHGSDEQNIVRLLPLVVEVIREFEVTAGAQNVFTAELKIF